MRMIAARIDRAAVRDYRDAEIAGQNVALLVIGLRGKQRQRSWLGLAAARGRHGLARRRLLLAACRSGSFLLAASRNRTVGCLPMCG